MIGRVGKIQYYTYVDTKLSDNIYTSNNNVRLFVDMYNKTTETLFQTSLQQQCYVECGRRR
jgi:hypothetical protein